MTHALQGVPLVNLITNLLRFDLQVVNEERFLKFTLDFPPMTPNQPALYNYLRGGYILLIQEQLAIMKKKNDDAKKEIGADFGALEEAEAKLLGRDRFMVEKPSEKEEIKVVKNEEPVSVSEQKESTSNTSAQSEVSGKDESHNSQESDQKQEESSTSNTSEKASESNNTNELSQPNDSNSVANQESNVSTNESSNNNNNEISASQ